MADKKTISPELIPTPSNLLENAILSVDGSKLLNIYDRYTGVPFNGTIISQLPSGLSVDNAVFFIVPDKFGGGYLKRDIEMYINTSWFGTISDYDNITGNGTDNTNIFALAASVATVLKTKMWIPFGKYMVHKFGRFNGIDIEGDRSEIYLKYNQNQFPSPVMIQIGNDSEIIGIKFYSLESDLSQQRCGIEQATNVILRRCGFYNFKNPSNSNSWGTYVKNSKNIIIDSCDYGGNTQSDIAILENNQNVVLINPSNSLDNGVHLNLEPNGILPLEGLVITGGIYRFLTTIINAFTGEPIKSVSFNGGIVKEYRYRGAAIKFTGTTVLSVRTAGTEYMGDQDVKLQLGDNLLRDPYLYDIEFNNPMRSWTNPDPNIGIWRVDRSGKDFTTINYTNEDQTSVVTTSNYLDAGPDKLFMLVITGRANYVSGGTQISRCGDIRCFSGTGTTNDPYVLVSTVILSMFRFPSGVSGTTNFQSDSVFFRVPDNASSFKLYLGNNNASTKSIDIKFVSINEVLGFNKGEYISDYVSRHQPKGMYKAISPSVGLANASAGGKIGDVVESFVSEDKVVNRWVCISEGRPSTYIPAGRANSDLTKLKRGTNIQRPTDVETTYLYYSTDFVRPYMWNGLEWIPLVPSATTGQNGTVKKSPILTVTQPGAVPPEVYEATYIKQIRDRLEALITGLKAAGIQQE